MSARCPAGHESQTEDYCDTCGAPIAATATLPEPGESPADSGRVVTAPSAAARSCPGCGAPMPAGDRFCEHCGHDIEAPPRAAAAWEAVIAADRELFERLGPEGLDFPAGAPAQVLALDRPEVCVGRRCGPAGDGREVDVSGAAGDPAVSRVHALLVRQDDGGYAVVDQGSSNGTTVNGADDPIPAHVPVTVGDGDRVHVGAWTTITIRAAG